MDRLDRLLTWYIRCQGGSRHSLKNINFKLKNIIRDQQGRFLLLDCEIEDNHMIIINFYCPTKDKLKLQLEFLETVKTHIENYSDKKLLIGGDLNTYLDPRLDKQGGRMETVSEYWKELTDLCEDYSLVDIWRIRNQNKKEFTRSANSRGGVMESSLYYWLVSMGITYLVYYRDNYRDNSAPPTFIFNTVNRKCNRN